MKHLTWQPSKAQARRSLLAAATATSVGLILWGTAQTTEPAAGEGPRPVADVVASRPASATAGTSPRIEFPHRTAATSADASLFAAHSWYVPPPPPPPAKAAPPVAPSAPPLPFSFLGSYGPAGDGAIYYLVKDDKVYDVKIGDTLDDTYSVDAVQEDELMLTYLPLKKQQALALRR